MEFNKDIPCPPSPKKGFRQYYDRQRSKWIYLKKDTSDIPCPPSPLKGYTTVYNSEKSIWEQVKIFTKDSN